MDPITTLADALDWTTLEVGVVFDRMIPALIDQHELIERILCAAGGVPVETVVPVDYAGKRADILFEADNLIVEIKSLTSDRRNDPQVATKLGNVFLQNTNLGGPIPFGEMKVQLHDLPPFAGGAIVEGGWQEGSD